MTTVNSSGFGALASVAWTPMDGTGLSATDLQFVNFRITVNTTLASDILKAVNGAVNSGRTAFSLEDLYPTGSTTPGNLNLTNIANHLSVVGLTLDKSTALSLTAWRKIATDLENDAALQASKRSVTSGGGVKSVNGKWYVNGQEVSLLDVYMAVRVNQVSNFDDSLALYMNELTQNNNLVKAANDWLARLRALKPDDTSSRVPFASINGIATSFSSTYGYFPSQFMPVAWGNLYPSGVPHTGGNYLYLTFDTWIEECKQYVSQKDTDNQIAQQKLEQMTNRRSEVLDGLTSFIKSQSQTGQGLSRNLG